MMTSCTDPIFSFQNVNRDHAYFPPRAVHSDLGIFRGHYPDIDVMDACLECPDFSSLLLNEEFHGSIDIPLNGQYSDDMSSSDDTVGISSSDDNISDDNSLTDAVIEMISEKGAPPAYERPKHHYSFTSTSANTLPKTTPSNKFNFSQTKLPQNIHDNSSKTEDKKVSTEINIKQESIRTTEATDENKLRGRPSRDHRSCKSIYSGANFDTKPKKVHKPRVKKTIHLWEFLEEIVDNKDYSPKYITWVSRDTGVFRLVDSKAVAKLWGQRKNRHDMTYEKMSRAIRYYYERGIIRHVMGQKLIYQFGDEINEKRKDKTQTKTLDENDQVSS